MAAAVLFTGPKPPPGARFCTICAATWKHQQLTALKAEIEQAQRTVGQHTIDLTEGRAWRIELAVADGIFLPLAPPPNGNGMMPLPVPLCWSHLLALSLTEHAVMPADASMMPGSGPGGAVMLDRR